MIAVVRLPRGEPAAASQPTETHSKAPHLPGTAPTNTGPALHTLNTRKCARSQDTEESAWSTAGPLPLSSVCPQGCGLQAASPPQQDRVRMGSSHGVRVFKEQGKEARQTALPTRDKLGARRGRLPPWSHRQPPAGL